MKAEYCPIHLFILLSCTLICCSNKEKNSLFLPVRSYKRIHISSDNPILSVILLHAYPVRKSSQNNNVNLYVCKESSNSKDSLFVFDISDSHPKLVFESDSRNQGYIINKISVKHFQYDSVSVNVPSGFITPKHINYIYASLTEALD